MTERENLLTVIAALPVAVQAEKRVSLVGRGLIAVQNTKHLSPEKATSAIHAKRRIRLGLLFYKGDFATRDTQESLKCCQLDAEQGDLGAQISLGSLYSDGIRIPQDYEEAAKWYRLAADQGDADGQFNLGAMYNNGTGVPQNDGEAVKWYRLAADQGNPMAQNNLGEIYRDGYGCPEEGGSDEADEPNEAWLLAYEESQIKAFDLFMLAAKEGHMAAQNNLGYMYREGAGVTLDQTKAAEWYQLAASQGSSIAQFELFKMYIDGLGVQQNYEKAACWCKKAAEQRLPAAQVKLGELYENGIWVEQNIERAKYWYQEAADHLHGDRYTPDEIVKMVFLEPSKASTCASGMKAIKALQRLSER